MHLLYKTNCLPRTKDLSEGKENMKQANFKIRYLWVFSSSSINDR